MKICNKCRKLKPITEFNKDKSRKNGIKDWCKDCVSKYGKEYFQKSKLIPSFDFNMPIGTQSIQKVCSVCDKIKYLGEFYKCNKGLSSICIECAKEKSSLSYLKNRERRDKLGAIWRKKNPDKCSLYHKNYYENNKEAVLTRIKKNVKNRRKNDENYRIKDNLRRRLNYAFKAYSKTGKCITSDEYGINYQAIIEHLGKCPGKRKDYHIDHIKPISLFNFDDPNQVKQAFAPENHMWLKKEDNLKKNNKYKEIV